jgi:hypothetical protein
MRKRGGLLPVAESRFRVGGIRGKQADNRAPRFGSIEFSAENAGLLRVA